MEKQRSGKRKGKKKKKFLEKAKGLRAPDVYQLSDQVNEHLGAAPFRDEDRLKAVEALLRLAQSDGYAYWCILKLLRDVAKSALEWQDMLMPGQFNQEELVQEAMLQTGIWKGTTQVAKALDADYLATQRGEILRRMQAHKDAERRTA